MPAATSKRVRNVSVGRWFVHGNESYALPHPDFPGPVPEGHTKGWKVWIRSEPGKPDILTWLKKVQFKLHSTYAEPIRTIEAPGPFEITETGYGEFAVDMKLYFDSVSGEKTHTREHWLRLVPYGDDEQRARQERTGHVSAEDFDQVSFNEPTADLYRNLTSESQWDYMRTSSGKGKKRKSEIVTPVDVECTAQPSKKMRQEEQVYLAGLKKADQMMDILIEEEKKKTLERAKRLEGIRTQIAAKG